MGMRKAFLLMATLPALFLFFDGSPATAAAAAVAGGVVNLEVHNCNNNNICEPQFGETYQGCPLDCNTPSTIGTISNPNPATSPGGSFNGSAIYPGSIRVEILSDTSVIIHWQTYGYSLGTLSWGKNTDADYGAVAEINYSTHHQIELDNLEPGTKYYFKIQSTDKDGHITYVGALPFVTTSRFRSPINVINFSYKLVGNDLKLSWKYSSNQSFRDVLILRSEYFYPTDPTFGKLIYKGAGNSVTDSNLSIDQDYYYAAFVENNDGNFSSGALLYVRLIKSGEVKVFTPTSTSTNKINLDSSTLKVKINLEQDNQQIYFYNSRARVKIGIPLKVIASIENLPLNFRELIVSVQDEDDATLYHSYNLMREGDTNTFQGILPSFKKINHYSFFIGGEDNNGKTISEDKYEIQTEGTSVPKNNWCYLWWILLILILYLLFRLYRRAKAKSCDPLSSR